MTSGWECLQCGDAGQRDESHPATQNSVWFLNLWIIYFWHFHLMFSDHCWLQVTGTMEGNPWLKGDYYRKENKGIIGGRNDPQKPRWRGYWKGLRMKQIWTYFHEGSKVECLKVKGPLLSLSHRKKGSEQWGDKGRAKILETVIEGHGRGSWSEMRTKQAESVEGPSALLLAKARHCYSTPSIQRPKHPQPPKYKGVKVRWWDWSLSTSEMMQENNRGKRESKVQVQVIWESVFLSPTAVTVRKLGL